VTASESGIEAVQGHRIGTGSDQHPAHGWGWAWQRPGSAAAGPL